MLGPILYEVVVLGVLVASTVDTGGMTGNRMYSADACTVAGTPNTWRNIHASAKRSKF